MVVIIAGIFVLLVLILLILGRMLIKSGSQSPIDRVMVDTRGQSVDTREVETSKYQRWSYKLSNRLMPKKQYANKPDPYRSLLAQADMEMTSEEFLLLRLLFTVAIGFLAYSIWKQIGGVVLAAAITWFFPRLIMRMRIAEKRKKFDDQLLDAIGVIANSLKAGYSFFQALSSVVEETQDPLSKEFKVMLKEMSLGMSIDHAFNSLMQRIYTEDLHLLTISVLIQRDIGGNLSELLENIGETIRERQQLKREMRTLTAQGRTSGAIIVGLPIFIALALFFLNREYISLLFTTTAGRIMLIVSAISQLIGIMIIKNIVNVEL